MRRSRVTTNYNIDEEEQVLKQEVDMAKLYSEMKGGVAFKDLETKMDAIIEQSRRDTDGTPEVSQQTLDYHRGYRTGIMVVFDEVAQTIEHGADAVDQLKTITSAKERAKT